MTTFSESYSGIYDFIYSDKDYVGEVGYIESVLNRLGHYTQGKATRGTLLDFGCGTGRHSVEFAKRGWSVTGVDRCEKMLFQASERAYAQGIQMAFEKAVAAKAEFDVVVSLFAVLNYPDPETELATNLSALRRSLRPDGVALFEVWNGVAVPFLSEARKSKRLAGPDGEELLRTTDISLDWMNQHMDVEFRLFRPPHEEEWFGEVHRMHYLTPQQFRHRLRDAGLEIIEILPAFSEAPVKHEDFNLIYVCRGGADA